jgi:hypothetical protein
MKNYLSAAIQRLRPTAEFSYSNNDYSTIQWDVLEGDAPTKAEIDAAIKAIEAEEKANEAKAATDKAALLAKLGITADEAKLLLS